MRILIELPTWLGDTVMATPAIENLFNFHKQSEFILVGTKIAVEIFNEHPRVSNTYVLEKKYSSIFYLSSRLGKFDKFFSFRNSLRSKLFKLLVKSRLKFCYKSEFFQKLHQVEKYTKFINNSLNIELPIGPLKIHSSQSLDKKAYSEDERKPMLGINPGASYGSAKRWYPDEFSEVIFALSNKYDITILGGPEEKEIAMDIQRLIMKKGVNNFKNLAGKLSISELIFYISTFDLFITGDSGPMHIAANYKVPTISIFGPTRSDETSQWMNDKGIVMKKNLSCQPCMKRVCPLKHHDCMRLIKAQDVLSNIKSLNL